MPARNTTIYRFGAFEFDSRTAELRKNGVRLKLQDQPSQILHKLLQCPGELVTREELRSILWRGDTFVDFENGLNTAVKRLRDALGESADAPVFIETMARRGYRFIAPVASDELTPRRSDRLDIRRLITILVAGLVGGALLLTIVFAFDIVGTKEWLLSHTTPIRSIAVLPLEDPSGNAEMDYLCQGVAEEVTNSLSRLPDLQVMAMTTATHYRSGGGDARAIGRNLHVDAILTGRVIEHGTELDVETELVDVATGAQIWGKRYTRNSGDVSTLPPVITTDLVARLRPQLGGAEQRNLAKVGTQNPEAYAFYLKGRYRYEKLTPADIGVAAGFLEEAVGLDNHFAAAYAALAYAYATQGYFGSVPASAAYNKARNAAKRALELDNTLPEAHLALAEVDLDYFMDLTEAQASIERARSLQPNSALVHLEICGFDNEVGRPQEAVVECRKALELEPLSLWYNVDLSITYYLAREYDKSLQQSNRTLQIQPGNFPSLFFIGSVYEVTGNEKGAVEQWARLQRAEGWEEHAEQTSELYRKSGYRACLKRYARDAEKWEDFYGAATHYALLGEKNAALDNLERAAAAGRNIDFLKLDPALDSIRSDPRYNTLLRRLGLPQ